MKIHFNWRTFSELTNNELYSVLSLRSKIFVVDQKCIYLDADGADKEVLHLLGMENGELKAYLRLFPPTDSNNYIKFGRVLTDDSVRKKGYGRELLKELMAFSQQHFPHLSIRCAAQHHLQKFYGEFGFETCGEAYEEQGILHIDMMKPVY